MRRPPAIAATAAIAAAVGGCGPDEEPPPAGCTVRPQIAERALLRAPRAVTLPGGARVSQCVMRARTDAELQELGALLTDLADRLARRAPEDRRYAVALGYLIGAVRRGAAQSAGIHAELVHRLERSGAELESGEGAGRAALRRGVAAGEGTG